MDYDKLKQKKEQLEQEKSAIPLEKSSRSSGSSR